ncbi:MAG: hypothetical protein ACXWLT_05905 [Rhizomicrobium sp.]
MKGKTVSLFALSILLMAAPALAEMSTESVTVTGSRNAYHDFSKTFATPTAVTGKMARWEHRICPLVVGQNAHYAAFITQHIKYVALAAGAPVNTEASCEPNIEIVFTATPQALLDTVAKDSPLFLGYFTSDAQKEALAKMTRPIQAWYATETTDIKGRHWADVDRQRGYGNRIGNLASGAADVMNNAPGQKLEGLPPFYASLGTRTNDGIHTGFRHVLIVVDSTKLAGQEIVPLSDYIAMLALTQINSLAACQELPSIVNRLVQDCGHPADSLTLYDLAYLQGLYQMTTGRGGSGYFASTVLQWNEIGDMMTDRLEKLRVSAAAK